MMLQHGLSLTMLLLSAWLAATGLQQGNGWLDRVVQFQKNKLFNEIKEMVPINMNVELRTKPEGYEDSRHWDYHSVLRLLTLIRASETGKPIDKALRRMLQPTRRIMMSMKQSMHRFPSLKKDDNNFYYDAEYTSAEEDAPPAAPVPADQAVIIVSNPVEARLPSAQISVKLLREILEARARAARQMPTTTAVIPWIDFIKNHTLTSTGTTETKKSTVTAADQTTGAVSDDDDDNPQPDGEASIEGDGDPTPEGQTTAGEESAITNDNSNPTTGGDSNQTTGGDSNHATGGDGNQTQGGGGIPTSNVTNTTTAPISGNGTSNGTVGNNTSN